MKGFGDCRMGPSRGFFPNVPLFLQGDLAAPGGKDGAACSECLSPTWVPDPSPSPTKKDTKTPLGPHSPSRARNGWPGVLLLRRGCPVFFSATS